MIRGLRGVLTIALLLVAHLALADAPPPGQARGLAESGLRKYQVGDYPGAIADFKQAYLIDPQPTLLFNIAQAHRLAGDCEAARRFYANYLHDSPAAPNLTFVQAKMADMQACIDAHAATKPPPPPPPAVVVVAPAPTRPEPARERVYGRAFEIVGIAALAVGTGLVVGGIAESVRAKDASREVGDVFAVPNTWNEHDRQLQATGRTATAGSIAMYSIGGAVLAAGAVMTGLAYGTKRRAHVEVGFSATGATAGWSCAF